MNTRLVVVGLAGLLLTLPLASALAGEGGGKEGGEKKHAPREKFFWRRHAREKNEEIAEKRKAADQAKAEELKAKWAAPAVDQRQSNQAKRIEGGIRKGYLTPEETARLEAQQKAIENLQLAYKSDGKVSHDEAVRLRQALNDASLDIFAEKHDGDGTAMPVYRLGKDVTLKDEVAQQLGSDTLTRLEARAMLADFRRLLELKRVLSNSTLADLERARLQSEYDILLNRYFQRV